MTNQDLLLQRTISRVTTGIILSWFKLYGKTADPKGNNERSLRAEARDPLWFLTRQWQLGEFKAEDAGSPLFAGCQPNKSHITSFSLNDRTEKEYKLSDAPLEPIIESEQLLDLFSSKERYKQLDLCIQISTQFNRFCAQKNIDPTYKTHYRNLFPLIFNEQQEAELQLFPQVFQQYQHAKLRLFDGVELLIAIRNGSHENWVWNQLDFPKEQKVNLLEAAKLLQNWYDSLYFQTNEPDGWDSKKMEYKAEFKTKGNSELTLKSRLSNGDLDWFSFEQEGNTLPPSPSPNSKWFIPTPIRFTGMASSRFWELEDGTVNLFKLDAQPTDLAKLIWGEFSLLYNDDWFVVPFEMGLGEIVNFGGTSKSFEVKDVFGFSHSLQSVQQGNQNSFANWQFLNIRQNDSGSNTSPDQVFMLPLAIDTQEGKVLEEVQFVRDEMSNLVWAIEKIIPSPSGHGVASDELYKKQEVAATKETDLTPKYVLGTSVPQNWIPFIPVSDPENMSEMILQRAVLPDNETKDSADVMQYRGKLLAGASPFYLDENQVPRAGKTLSRNFQRTRWLNGKTILWIGKRIRTGKGEASSGLKFDQLD